MRRASNTLEALRAIAANPQTVIERGSMVRLKQGGNACGLRFPERVNDVTEYNAIFFRDNRMALVPLAWLEPVS